jgi:hypothetical protein
VLIGFAEVIQRSVWLSAGARTTTSVAIVLPAPGRFSMKTNCKSDYQSKSIIYGEILRSGQRRGQHRIKTPDVHLSSLNIASVRVDVWLLKLGSGENQACGASAPIWAMVELGLSKSARHFEFIEIGSPSRLSAMRLPRTSHVSIPRLHHSIEGVSSPVLGLSYQG